MPPKKRGPPSIHARLPDAKAKGANKKPKLHRILAKVEFLESPSKPAKGKPKSAKGKGMKVEGTKKTGKVGRPPSGKENTTTPKVKKKKKGKKKPKDIYKGQTFTKTFPGDKTLYNGKVGNLEDVKGKKEEMYFCKYDDGDNEHIHPNDLSELLCEDRNLVGRKFKVLEIEGGGGIGK